MRVVGGLYRGRRLASPKGREVRPTSDRVREAAFNLLGPLDGESVLDLFAGTGAMGIEALSRGAAQVTFVEIDRAAYEVTTANVRSIVDTEQHEANIVKADARLVAQGATPVDGPFDLIIIDPPYRLLGEFIIATEAALGTLVAPDGTVLLELETRSKDLALKAADAWGLDLRTVRRYGDTSLALLDNVT